MADSDVINYLTSLKAVRERSRVVFEAAKVGSLTNFEYHADKLPAAADFVISVIERDFGPDKFNTIPPHGRWQHFNVGSIDRITPLLEKWEAAGCDKTELTRRLIDLFVISVLLDAGAGDVWTFKETDSGNVYNRSEGIAVASLHMFLDGALSSNKSPTVDAKGLIALTDDVFNKHFQITPENPMVGISSRVQLLNSVGKNGGLFVDMGVLTLKDEIKKSGLEASSTPGLPLYDATGDVIVEWRALTLALLDELYIIVRETFQAKGVELSMAQMLEAGTWKGGRELAAKYRPETKSSPILIDGDGTLF
ncbi:Protein urg3 [Ceratocystis platani]|uniref:Protein urg3 n=1 Tax=Ceratocystis fimbriata f. sp. platani TaxID=88771 RepID=A0A0F8CRP6_CERFI|nr:Protein urg3 [Ceratocystis platani]